MVVAEAAVAIPVLFAVAMVLVWVVSLAASSLRLGDATRQAARDIARGVVVPEALAAARDRAPGAVVQAVDQGSSVLVTADREVSAPVLTGLTVTVHQEVVVPKEWGP